MENTTQISYDRLWKLLIDRKLKKKGLQELTHLSPSVKWAGTSLFTWIH